ncbi:MAG: CheR family methyltransferase [Deferrisomatales bacterium]
MDPSVFGLIADLVYGASGIRLTARDEGVVASRVEAQRRRLGLPSLEAYLAALGAPGGPEVADLLDALTVNYTFFFRDPRQFRFLSAEVLPALLRPRGPAGGGPVRFWSAGCSTGEEPYSIATCVAEAVAARPGAEVRGLATDVNRRVLGVAARGAYPVSRCEGFPAEWRYKYLVRDAQTPSDCLRLCPEVRRLVVCRRHDVTREAPGLAGKFHVIFCRNVMMYFDGADRARVVANLGRCLTPGGYLFVGESEGGGIAAAGLEAAGPAVYRRR